MIIKCYPTLFPLYRDYNTLHVLNITEQLALVPEPRLDPQALAQSAQDAVAAFIAAGTAPNTARSYRGALSYWSAWFQARYGQTLSHAPVPAAVAVQFVLDHLARRRLGADAAANNRRVAGGGQDQSQTGPTEL